MLTQIDAGSSYALLLAGYLLFGIALGLVYAPMSTAAMAAMPAEKVGIASGVLAMDRVMAGTIALAATGAVFHALLGGGGSFADAVAGSTWVAGRPLRRRRARSPGPSSATRSVPVPTPQSPASHSRAPCSTTPPPALPPLMSTPTASTFNPSRRRS